MYNIKFIDINQNLMSFFQKTEKLIPKFMTTKNEEQSYKY